MRLSKNSSHSNKNPIPFIWEIVTVSLMEDLANSIQQLILLGKGDVGRLEYILDLIKKGKMLTLSDQKYLKNMLLLYVPPKDVDSTSYYERIIGNLYDEIESLNEKLTRFEKKGFERYIGKKTILLFATIFVGWNALQPYVISLLNLDMSNNVTQYFFPLYILANYFGATSMVSFIFILMVLVWPFIGTIILANSIKIRKIHNN